MLAKILHFYADLNPAIAGPHIAEKHFTPTAMLTEGMVMSLLRACAFGASQFTLVAPRWIVHEVESWTIPKGCLSVIIIDGRPITDFNPVDTAHLLFEDGIVFIYARRLLPYEPYTCSPARKRRMLEGLQAQMKQALLLDGSDMRDMSPAEKWFFSQRHPGAHLVIGDFEIRCIKPENYNL
jgi:hypothetical protein